MRVVLRTFPDGNHPEDLWLIEQIGTVLVLQRTHYRGAGNKMNSYPMLS